MVHPDQGHSRLRVVHRPGIGSAPIKGRGFAMSTEQSQQPAGAQPPGNDGAFTQEIQHSQLSARVPERVSRGVFSTGAMVLQGPYEFVIDFMLRMSQPQQIVARVALPLALMPSLIAALRDNL